MTTITAQKRDKNVKAKKLRREGFIPGSLCGKDVKEQTLIKIPEKDAMTLIRENQKGEKVELNLDNKKYDTIVKDFSYNTLLKKLEVLDFQVLVAGEKIHNTVEIILKNETLAAGVVTQNMSEIHYKADSNHLLDTIVIDFEKLKDVKSMKVSDLKEFKDGNITVSDPEAVIFSVKQVMAMDEDEEEEEAAK